MIGEIPNASKPTWWSAPLVAIPFCLSALLPVNLSILFVALGWLGLRLLPDHRFRFGIAFTSIWAALTVFAQLEVRPGP